MIPPASHHAKSSDCDPLFALERTIGHQGGVMSQSLPARPSLEHLRKQAKDLLPTLQLQHSEAKLADAQDAIARGYGFPNWTQLKRHVDSAVADADSAGAAQSPFAGTWVASLAKSSRHPLNQFQSATLS